jgi:hypothetical protein
VLVHARPTAGQAGAPMMRPARSCVHRLIEAPWLPLTSHGASI